MLFKQSWILLFLLVLAADVAALLFAWPTGEFIFKTLLVPMLLVGLLQHKKNTSQINWLVIMAGLVTAWAGDVLLLFSADIPKFFILGLVCFLCTHLAYILYFSRYKKKIKSWFLQHPLLTFLVVLYAVSLFALLQPHLGGLMAPVGVYTLVITIMMLKALSVQPLLPVAASRFYFVAGAALFVLSDSLLAINKFYQPLTFAGPLIMLTYGLAQLLVVCGTVLNTDRL